MIYFLGFKNYAYSPIVYLGKHGVRGCSPNPSISFVRPNPCK